LKEEIRFLKSGKSSSTSSTPPSMDIAVQTNNRSLREKSGKKPGGQIGHKGSNLEMFDEVDESILYELNECPDCGGELSKESSIVEVKQVIEIPKILPKVVEHVSVQKTCSCCHKSVIKPLPLQLKNHIQYGASVSAFIAYLHAAHYIPVNRISSMLDSIFGIKMSDGTVMNHIEKMAEKCADAYEQIRLKIYNSNVIGADETGVKIAGNRGWLHAWQTTNFTYIKASLSRGFDAMIEVFPNLQNSTLVSDCWAAQLKMDAVKHQICFAHLLRDLKKFEQDIDCQWSISIKALFKEAMLLKREMTSDQYINKPEKVIDFEKRLDELLKMNSEKLHWSVKPFLKRLIKNRNSIFTFLHQEDCPYDNNGSERAIRNAKVKSKVSGGYRALKGAQNYAILRSITDTAVKNNINVLDNFFNLASAE
jgi:transposase